jgi:hypothetical protein
MALLKIFKNVLNAMGQTYSLVGTVKGDILLEFDTIDECATTGSATVTKYPTEKGTHVTDYKYKNPDTVRMTGVISSGGATGYTSVLSRLGSWDRQTAIESIRANLRELVEQMTLMNIQTRNAGRRDNMTLTSYEINETYDNFGSMEVTMNFTEVRRFGPSGVTVRNASDTDTQESGITMTQAVMLGVSAITVGSSIIRGNAAALR